MLNAAFAKVSGRFKRRQDSSEFDSEIAAHIEMLAEHYKTQGLTAEEAKYQARRQFGNTTSLKESRHEQQSFAALESVTRQVRLAVRQLRSSPVFTFMAVLSLALGIGATTSVFTVLDQLLLRLLPVKDPQSIVMISSAGESIGSIETDSDLSYPLYEEFQKSTTPFESVFGRYLTSADLSTRSRSERVLAELVSGNYFDALGVKPALGRVFSPERDDRRYMGHPVVVLQYAYWRARFAGDAGVLGRKILINGYPMEIVGVSSEKFSGVDPYRPPQIFVPFQMQPVLDPGANRLGDRWARWMQVFARLKPGYTATSAQAALQVLFHNILARDSHDVSIRDVSPYRVRRFLEQKILVRPAGNGYSELRNMYQTSMVVLMGMAGLMLLVACSNVANLLTARAAGRQKETAVHLALGASRATLVSRLLTESLLLSAGAGVIGVGWACGATSALLAFLPQSERLNLRSLPDMRVLAFTLCTCVLTALVFGLAPALQGTRLDVWTILKDSAGSLSGTVSAVRFRKLLVAAQVLLSFLLLAGAALFTHSLLNLRGVNTGFSAIDRICTFQLDAPRAGYGIVNARNLYDQVLQRVRLLPGVEEASYAMVPVLNAYSWSTSFSIEGQSGDDSGRRGWYNTVSPGYWRTMGIPLLNGRDFDWTDRAHTGNTDERPTVAIVNRAFAAHFFGSVGNAIGKHVGFGGMRNRTPSAEIIGVVENTLYDGPRDGVRRQVFFPFREANWPLSAVFYVREQKPSSDLLAAVSGVVRRIDTNVPVYEMSTVQAQLAATLGTERLIATLSLVFGALAACLAAAGLYGVMAFVVARRTKEIGIRMALGAERPIVLWGVLRETLMLIIAGVGAGLPIALALSQYAAAQLFGVRPTDPLTYLSAAVLLGMIALISGYFPARRASAISPLIALRYE